MRVSSIVFCALAVVAVFGITNRAAETTQNRGSTPRTSTGARPGPALAPTPVATIKELMAAIVDPAADGVWGAVAVIESASGVEEKAPRTDDDWAKVRAHALTVAESGNLLMLPGRAKDQHAWMAMSRALVEAGTAAARAAETKDTHALLDAGDQLFAACASCHQLYWEEGPTGAVAPLPPPPVRKPRPSH